jgi:hypothetical protein
LASPATSSPRSGSPTATRTARRFPSSSACSATPGRDPDRRREPDEGRRITGRAGSRSVAKWRGAMARKWRENSPGSSAIGSSWVIARREGIGR